MSVETVKTYLKSFGRDEDVQEFPVSSATVELAAAALSVEPARIAKTLSFADGDGCLLVVTAGDQKIDNAKFKAAFGMKAKMLPAGDVLRLTGHAVGGVCPFALPEGVRVTLDMSLRRLTPNNIVNMARLAGLSAIALTDHNACGNCPAILEAARGSGLAVLPGMELCTSEEAHVVCLFPTLEAALAFEARIRPTLPPLKNQPEIFGEQLILDGEDTITGHSDAFLAGASGISVYETAALARSFGGTAFPAHIDRPSYSVPAALGDIPPVGFFAAEVTAMGDPERMQDRYPAIRGLPLLLNSDAHFLHQIQEAGPYLDLPCNTPGAVIAALNGENPCEWGR